MSTRWDHPDNMFSLIHLPLPGYTPPDKRFHNNIIAKKHGELTELGVNWSTISPGGGYGRNWHQFIKVRHFQNTQCHLRERLPHGRIVASLNRFSPILPRPGLRGASVATNIAGLAKLFSKVGISWESVGTP